MLDDAEKAGLGMDDISVFELNEAFASQVAYCIKKLGLPREKLNPNGRSLEARDFCMVCPAAQVAS